MSEIIVSENGAIPLFGGSKLTTSPEITVNAPANLNGASAAISYERKDGTVIPYTDGALLANDQKRVRAGENVKVVLNVTGFVSSFTVVVGN